jgi:hypothetical protein
VRDFRRLPSIAELPSVPGIGELRAPVTRLSVRDGGAGLFPVRAHAAGGEPVPVQPAQGFGLLYAAGRP